MRDHRIRRAEGSASRSCSRASSASSTAATTRPGIALLEDDGLDYVRAVGNLQNLKEAAGPNGSLADHRPRPHPLGDARRRHRGERAPADRLRRRRSSRSSSTGSSRTTASCKAALDAEGHTFTSETDAEAVAHLIERHYEGDLTEAVREGVRASSRATSPSSSSTTTIPSELVGARHQTPLVVGVGEGEMFLASNAAAFLQRDAPACSSRTTARSSTITPDGVGFIRVDGEPVEHEPVELDWDDEGAEKGGYETFMLKEIYEQPEAVAETIGDRVRHGTLVLEGLGMTEDELRKLRRIVILACGTAYHAGVVGRYVIEEWARDPGRAGHRQRVDLPQPGDRRGHARDRHLAVGRDARHDRGDEARPREGRAHGRDHEHDGLADHARGRLRRSTRAAASRSASPPRRRSPRRSRCSTSSP